VAIRLMSAHIQLLTGPERLPAARQAIPVLERIGDRRALLDVYWSISNELAQSGAFVEGEKSIARVFELADDLGWQRSGAYIALLQLRCLMRCYAGRFDEARIDLAKSIALKDTIGEKDATTRLRSQAYLEFVDGNVQNAEELLENGTTLAIVTVIGLDELAATRLVLGKIDAAEAAARTALQLGRFDEPRDTLGPIQHLATVAALRGRPRGAARLLGFVNAKFPEVQRVRSHYQRAGYDILAASLRDQLSKETIESLAADGALLDLDRAADEALSLG
jgi:hypothetical protein